MRSRGTRAAICWGRKYGPGGVSGMELSLVEESGTRIDLAVNGGLVRERGEQIGVYCFMKKKVQYT